MITEFRNEPFTDFTIEENVRVMKSALKLVESKLGLKYDLIIGGKKTRGKDMITSINPSNYNEVVGFCASADIEDAERAMESASHAFAAWQYTDPFERANYLFKAASILRRRKFEFSAWLVIEAGKTWAEADADTAEAIDFLEYYGRQMIKFSKGSDLTIMPGEINDYHYVPLGVGIIISPWNFPLAILTGMASAAVVAGNTVIVKPAGSTPIIASKFMELWEEACLPDGVINLLPGPGNTIGEYLVSHPGTRFINFTGSKSAGLRINSIAAQTAPSQRWIKRVTAEMGGKDSIIVDNETDLDIAADGIVSSAFGFQGQKCSACSRAIILDSVYDEMLEKLNDKTNKLKTGISKDPSNNLGPVIDEKAYNNILNYIEIGKQEGQLLIGGSECGTGGYFISPTIFHEVAYDSRIAQEEIFGPVLAVIKAQNFDDAVRIANSTEYGLTGAVYTDNRQNIQKAKREFNAGNLYINRKCTGALVGIHPFGGFNMSGTDSKAGGPDYLLLFMQPKTISEKL